MSMVREVSERAFRERILEAGVPVLAEFFAPTSGPCKVAAATLAQLALEYDGRVEVMRLNTDRYPGLIAEFAIRGLPTVLLFHDGVLVNRLLGVRSHPEYRRMFDQILAADRRADEPPSLFQAGLPTPGV